MRTIRSLLFALRQLASLSVKNKYKTRGLFLIPVAIAMSTVLAGFSGGEVSAQSSSTVGFPSIELRDEQGNLLPGGTFKGLNCIGWDEEPVANCQDISEYPWFAQEAFSTGNIISGSVEIQMRGAWDEPVDQCVIFSQATAPAGYIKDNSEVYICKGPGGWTVENAVIFNAYVQNWGGYNINPVPSLGTWKVSNVRKFNSDRGIDIGETALTVVNKKIKTTINLSGVSSPVGPTDPLITNSVFNIPSSVSPGVNDCQTIESVKPLSGSSVQSSSPLNTKIIGGLDFSVMCSNGGVTTATYKLGGAVSDVSTLRIYSYKDGKLQDYTDKATITKDSDGHPIITFALKDGESWDNDGLINGLMTGTMYVGLVQKDALAETGSPVVLSVVGAVLALIGGVGVLRSTRKA